MRYLSAEPNGRLSKDAAHWSGEIEKQLEARKAEAARPPSDDPAKVEPVHTTSDVGAKQLDVPPKPAVEPFDVRRRVEGARSDPPGRAVALGEFQALRCRWTGDRERRLRRVRAVVVLPRTRRAGRHEYPADGGRGTGRDHVGDHLVNSRI